MQDMLIQGYLIPSSGNWVSEDDRACTLRNRAAFPARANPR